MKKVNIIKIVISMLIIISFLTITEKTYAYWDSNNLTITNEYILIGNWIFGYEPVEWVNGGSYDAGDIVIYNGNAYIRTNVGGGPIGGMFPPDSFLGWLFWDQT